MYIHLTTHSAYSLQEGLTPPADLVRAAQSYGMSAIGLTDRNLLTGTIEFVTACIEANIQPIIGLEITLENNPLHLLATSLEGWSNLCRLSSALALKDHPNQPCSLDMISTYSKDLIALASNPAMLIDIFPDRLYVSLNHPSQAISITTLARRPALPTVVTHPVYFLAPEQSSLQKTIMAIRLNQTVASIPKESYAPTDAWFMSPQEVENRFKDFPAALATTMEIAERCKFELPWWEPSIVIALDQPWEMLLKHMDSNQPK